MPHSYGKQSKTAGAKLVEAFRPTADQIEAGEFPPYAQLVLRCPFSPSGTSGSVAELYLDDAMSWAIRDALGKAQHVNGGQSIIEQLEAELDGVIDRLMADGPGAERSDIGQAQGLCTAVSKLRSISYPAAREAAMDRWEARNQGEDED